MSAAVVLAAGVGRRLSSVTDLPKWLVPIGDDAPVAAQLDALVAHGFEHVFVVVGEQEEIIAEAVEPWRTSVDIEFVINPHALTRNNWYSMLVGLERASGASDRLVFLNSDVYASRQWFAEALQAVEGAADVGAALAIDPARGRSDEAMKVSIDESGRIIAIGKTGVDRVDGEFVGVGALGRSGADHLCRLLRAKESDADAVDHWYEHAVQELIGDGFPVAAAPTGPAWVEIDDEHDHRTAVDLWRH